PEARRRFDDWRGSGVAITHEDLHDAIFAGELDLLDPLALQLFFRRQVVLVLERGELFLELEVLQVELPELLIPIEQRPYQLFVLSLHCAISAEGALGVAQLPRAVNFLFAYPEDTCAAAMPPRVISASDRRQ